MAPSAYDAYSNAPESRQVDPPIQAACDQFRKDCQAVRDQIARVIVGHHDVIQGVLTCLMAGGHALLEGVPGLGKTTLVRATAGALDLQFGRIQFTPDLMPADIVGTNIITESEHGQRSFSFAPGPVFSQILLADEINRATPKTQSALLEAMQERQVTAGGHVRKLPEPFFVLATQNSLEHEGTYPLPEAQLDRFFFKLLMGYSSREEMSQILGRTTTDASSPVEAVLDATRLLAHQQLVRRVIIAPPIQDYAIRCVLATQPAGAFAVAKTNQFLRVGAGPRAAQAIVLGAKVRALIEGRFYVSTDDVKAVWLAAVRHRVILNFEAEAQGIGADSILGQIVADVPITPKA
jgi:MoxR-like ATPase